LLVSSRLKESTAALRSRLPLAVPALFELFVKRERPQQVSYRILPNFVEFLVGRLDLGCRDRSPPDAPPARCCPGCPAAPAGADLAAAKREVGPAQRRHGGIVRDSSWTAEIIHERWRKPIAAQPY
jgi:hypothetical protein